MNSKSSILKDSVQKRSPTPDIKKEEVVKPASAELDPSGEYLRRLKEGLRRDFEAARKQRKS
jgi:hypothetical protein